MDKVLKYLAKYNITPLQLVCWITYSLECHIDDIKDGGDQLYPENTDKLLDELNELSWRI